MVALALYAVTLLAFTGVGVIKCRRGLTKVIFALASLSASVILFVLAFFSQMAP